MHLDRFPRLSLAHLPTRLEPMDRLSNALGGPRIWIKRDDCTGLATGGNKTRKLEFLMADARDQGADTVITCGAVQSNHVRQTAAAAALLGFGCVVLLEHRIGAPNQSYLTSGNVLLDRLFGAQVEHMPEGANVDECMSDAYDRLKHDGKKPYLIPGGGSNRIGALGYVDCALEIGQQLLQMELAIDCLVHATGSSGTQAGLLAGIAASSSPLAVLGIGVRAPQEIQEQKVFDLACATAEYIGAKNPLKRESVVADCNYIGEGYGIPTDGTLEAVELVARLEGILLDPVYTGKGMAGLIDKVRNGTFRHAKNILFLHTGGAASLFGYQPILEGRWREDP